MKSCIGTRGFVAGLVITAVGMVVFSSGAFAGWVIESDTEPYKAPAAGGEASKADAEPLLKVTIRIQDKKSRVDSGEEGSILLDGESGGMTLLMHKKKTYLKVSKERLAQVKQGEPKGEGEAAKELVKAKATGKTDKINGFNVEEFVAQTPKEKLTFWVSKDGADVERLKAVMTETLEKVSINSPQVVDYTSLPGYPIRTIRETPEKTYKTGIGVVNFPKETSSFTVKTIKEEALDVGVFTVPADYTQQGKSR